jgi:hypothetical protein
MAWMVGAWMGIENGKEVLISYDPTRTDKCKFNFSEVPDGFIEIFTGKPAAKLKEPIELTSQMIQNVLTMKNRTK